LLQGRAVNSRRLLDLQVAQQLSAEDIWLVRAIADPKEEGGEEMDAEVHRTDRHQRESDRETG
jgi:hypothetical protein